MKYLCLLLLLLLSGAYVNAWQDDRILTGEKVFEALLSKGDLYLKDVPLCSADMKLYEQIALSLSTSYNTKNITVIDASCSPSRYETENSSVIDIWDCTVQINENSPSNEYISSSTYVFGLTRSDHTLIEASLRCR